MREFEVAVGRAAVNKADEVTFLLDTDELVAKAPTAGQLALFLRGSREGGMTAIQSLLDLMEAVLDPKGYLLLQKRLRQGMDMMIVSSMATYLVEEWSGRPIQPPSGSTPTLNGTGPESTETPSDQAELEPAIT